MRNRIELYAYLYCNLFSTQQPLSQIISYFTRDKEAKRYDPFLKWAHRQLESISLHREVIKMTGTAALSVCQEVCSHKCRAFQHSGGGGKEREEGWRERGEKTHVFTFLYLLAL